MSKPQKTGIEPLERLSQAAAAWLIGVTPQTLRSRGGPRNEDKSYNGQNLVKWDLKRAQGTDADPTMADTVAAVERRYRLAKAEREELELAARRGHLADVDELLTFWDSEVAAPVRKALEALQKRFGGDAARLVVDALERASGAIGKRLRENEHK